MVIKKGREEDERKKGENESLSKSGEAWSLLFCRGVPTDLKEWILGFGSGKKEEKGGNIRESYRYKIYMLLPFLLCFSLLLLFADSC